MFTHFIITTTSSACNSINIFGFLTLNTAFIFLILNASSFLQRLNRVGGRMHLSPTSPSYSHHSTCLQVPYSVFLLFYLHKYLQFSFQSYHSAQSSIALCTICFYLPCNKPLFQQENLSTLQFPSLFPFSQLRVYYLLLSYPFRNLVLHLTPWHFQSIYTTFHSTLHSSLFYCD